MAPEVSRVSRNAHLNLHFLPIFGGNIEHDASRHIHEVVEQSRSFCLRKEKTRKCYPFAGKLFFVHQNGLLKIYELYDGHLPPLSSNFQLCLAQRQTLEKRTRFSSRESLVKRSTLCHENLCP